MARFRQRSAEINRLRDTYKALMGRVAAGDMSPTAEIARVAESLGRRFEAEGWWSLRVRQFPDDRQASTAVDRLAQRLRPCHPRPPT